MPHPLTIHSVSSGNVVQGSGRQIGDTVLKSTQVECREDCSELSVGSPGVPSPAPIPLGLEAEQGDVMAVGPGRLEVLMDPISLNL